MSHDTSDIALVREMLAGDEAAFERFFDTAYPALYRFALIRLAFDQDAAADVAQTTICNAISKLHTFRGEAALLSWLCTFCRHELYAWGKRHGGRLRVELLEDDPEIRAALESLRVTADVESALDRATSLLSCNGSSITFPRAMRLHSNGNTSTRSQSSRLALG